MLSYYRLFQYYTIDVPYVYDNIPSLCINYSSDDTLALHTFHIYVRNCWCAFMCGVCSLIAKYFLAFGSFALPPPPLHATKHSTSDPPPTPTASMCLCSHCHRINYVLLIRAAFMNAKGENALCRRAVLHSFAVTIQSAHMTCSEHGLYMVRLNCNIYNTQCS